MVGIDRQALDRLQNLVGGDEADVIELVNSFIEEVPGLMQAMANSFRAADLTATRRAAHTIKSNAKDMGATELAGICARIEERSARGERLDETDVQDAARALQVAVAELQSMFSLGGQA